LQWLFSRDLFECKGEENSPPTFEDSTTTTWKVCLEQTFLHLNNDLYRKPPKVRKVLFRTHTTAQCSNKIITFCCVAQHQHANKMCFI
jgi:hypothetical protein